MKAFFLSLVSILASVAVYAGEKLNAAVNGYMHSHGLILSAIPNAGDFDRNRVTNRAQSEIYRQRFYDSILYATAGAQQLTFFSLPVGQGLTTALGAAAGTPKTLFDTNLELGNSLPSGKSFLIETIELIFTPGSVNTANTYTPFAPGSLIAVPTVGLAVSPINDVNIFYQAGLLSLNVLSKNYLREFVAAFPPKASLEIDAAAATNSATTLGITYAWAKQGGRPYYLEPKITLQPGVNFEITVTYPAAVATPSGFNGRVQCILDGYWLRATQ
jgi:hypothetical protein